MLSLSVLLSLMISLSVSLYAMYCSISSFPGIAVLFCRVRLCLFSVLFFVIAHRLPVQRPLDSCWALTLQFLFVVNVPWILHFSFALSSGKRVWFD